MSLPLRAWSTPVPSSLALQLSSFLAIQALKLSSFCDPLYVRIEPFWPVIQILFSSAANSLVSPAADFWSSENLGLPCEYLLSIIGSIVITYVLGRWLRSEFRLVVRKHSSLPVLFSPQGAFGGGLLTAFFYAQLLEHGFRESLVACSVESA